MKQSIVMEASNMINEIRRDHLYIIENVSNKMRRRMPKGQDEKQRNLTQSSSSPCCCYICINVSYVGSDFLGKCMGNIMITVFHVGDLQKDCLLQNHYVSDTKKRWILRWIEGLKHFLSP